MAMATGSIAIHDHLHDGDHGEALRHDVRRGLTGTPKQLFPKWLYDERGCDLFDEITRLAEYYPTRAERSILEARADAIAVASRADTLVELGSGTSEKTRLLLDALAETGSLRRFVPFDVAASTLRDAAVAVSDEHPGIEVEAVVGDFERHLGEIPTGGTRMIAFLGGTIGNLDRAERARFLTELAGTMAPGDTLLLGTDLVKDHDRLVAAYDDAAGVTADFNKNVLAMINRELDADFDLDRFEHVARFDTDTEQIEMRLRSTVDQQVAIDGLDLTVDFAAGEEVRTEISSKFRHAGLRAELAQAGLHLTHWWTDEPGDFALSMSSVAGSSVAASGATR